MPLLKRKEVPLLGPPPGLAGVPDEQEVWYMAKTGEVFLDYETYSHRLAYLMRRVFACSSSGRTGLDYFSALSSEQRESELVRSRFPVELKPRVLKAANFQMDGRLDSLIDRMYERFHNRFFRREKVFVDLQGDKYYAQIAKIFPPKPVRELAKARLGLQPPHASTSGSPLKNEVFPSGLSPARLSTGGGPIGSPVLGINVSPSASSSSGHPPPTGTTPNAGLDGRLEREFNDVAHSVGTDLDLDAQEAVRRDDPDEYLYTVQLMDENSNFEGSFMEVKSKQLGRDRLSFSKSILKRYVRESVHRDPAIGSPWEIKPTVARQFGLSTVMSAETAERNASIRQGKLSRRRKGGSGAAGSDDGTEGGDGGRGGKRRKGGQPEDEGNEAKRELERRERETKNHVKYPSPSPCHLNSARWELTWESTTVEDLQLSPLSIIDGRMLRRANGTVPELPKKPLLRRDLPVPFPLFERFLTLWNFLNTFGRALRLSPFTLDDFLDALHHPAHEPASTLLGDIHGTLVNLLGAHNDLRYPGTVGCSADGVLPYFARTDDEVAKLSVEHQEHWIREALTESKKWDRGPKRKGEEVRERWELRTTGALCQRGGCEIVPSLGRLMRFLYAKNGEDEPTEEERGAGGAPPSNHKPVASEKKKVTFADGGAEGDGEEADELEDDGIAERAEADPRERYPRLPLEAKLDMLAFLCDVVRDSRVVRQHIEEAEGTLTELRKERADVNRERKQLVEEIAAREAKKAAEAAAAAAAAAATTTTATGEGDEVKPNGGTPAPAVSTVVNGTVAGSTSQEDEDVDMLDWSEEDDDDDDASSSDRKRPLALGDEDGGVGADGDEGREEGEDEEVDELASESSSYASGSSRPRRRGGAMSGSTSPVVETSGGGRPSHVSARRAALESRVARRQADEQSRLKTAKAATSASKTKRKAQDERKRLDDELARCERREESFSREFRRWNGVARMRPLGSDRFHCRYWWLDGVGAMSLVGQGGNVLWSTGRIFVSGPTEGEWEATCDEFGGREEMEARRRKEEGNGEEYLRPGEWGWIGDEAELDALVPWLNQKGKRELELRLAIRDWRDYIVGGMKRRIKQLEDYEARVQEDDEAVRRSNRARNVPAWQRKPYMSYHNKLAGSSRH